MANSKKWLAMVMSLCVLSAYADTQVNVVGLFSDKALLMINGVGPQTIRAGQTINGVKLISADSNAATLIIEGKRQVLKMGQGVSAAASKGSEVNAPVNLFADSRGHFYGNLQINGATLKYVVDTGATTVAMNSGDAKYAKIDYEKGEKVPVSTANGMVTAYLVRLNTLKIGTIVLNNVEATVNEGGSPSEVLLGMSALNRLDMKRDNSVMTLSKKY
ncbi:MAG TPA: TIGR02281 family clan AA aspartic protease [Methylophilus sp.]|nr:TIGR02281 family clan AA aspartic protease [Methylophilus sp.]HQQ32873.1 TIGR02281 family clan AA aspartic protease [Methylophilus sp.]